ncbi:hypothetical protein PS15m_001174 [Mucor circinelloides]
MELKRCVLIAILSLTLLVKMKNCNFLQMRLIIEEVRWQLTAVENTYKSNTQQWSKMLGLQAEVKDLQAKIQTSVNTKSRAGYRKLCSPKVTDDKFT